MNENIKQEKKKIIVFAGGGTGGHIYPALAITKEIERLANVEIHFVGSRNGLENKIIPKEGYPLHLISVGPLNKSAGRLKRIKTLILLPFSFLQAVYLCFKLRPDSVLGLGGYVSVPFVLVASFFTRVAIWEPNAFPGLANRLLTRFVKKSFVVFENAKKLLGGKNSVRSGMPVRFEIKDIIDKKNREKSEFNVLVFGGSQGAKAINQIVKEMICETDIGGTNKSSFTEIKFTHQTGFKEFNDIKKRYDSLSEKTKSKVNVKEYLHDMKEEYSKADLVICRAGASTVAELAASGKASILIPYPWAADDHQKLNAMELAEQDAAIVIEQKNLTEAVLKENIIGLKNYPEKLKEMESNVRKFHNQNAANEIANWLLNH